jgi:hypothetical protein
MGYLLNPKRPLFEMFHFSLHYSRTVEDVVWRMSSFAPGYSIAGSIS